MSGHAKCSSARRRAAAPIAARRGSSARMPSTAVDERADVAGRDGDGGLGRHDLTVALDVRRDDRRRARERARQHHPEALAAERRREERLGRAQEVGERVLREEPDDLDPGVGHAEPGQQEPHGERVGARHDEPRAGAPVDLRPRAEKHVEPLARLVPPREDDGVLPARRVGLLGDEDAVRDDLPRSSEPPVRRVARALRDGDALVDPVHQEAPRGHAEPHPAEVARRVVGRDDRLLREREDGDADGRGHRLVEVEHVEPLALEHAPDAEDRPRAEHDVGQRAVRRDDHRAADGDDVRRRVAVTADARVERTGELAGRIVAHHQPDVVPTGLERGGLKLRVLDDRPPERPRERHDDADLHAGSLLARPWCATAVARLRWVHASARRPAPRRRRAPAARRPRSGRGSGRGCRRCGSGARR